MINIAICDDDMAMTTTIEEMLYETSKEQNVKIIVLSFLTDPLLWKISVREPAMT